MQDKTFLQAMQDLQDKISVHIDESMLRMLLHRTTATSATLGIQDEHLRAVVTDELIVNQIIALLLLMKDLSIIDDRQYNEFTAYLLRSPASQRKEAAS